MNTSLGNSSNNSFQSYTEWMRYLAHQFSHDTNFITDELLEICSPVSRTPLCINMGSGVLDKNNNPYLVARANLHLYRQDLSFWDKFIDFSFQASQDQKGSTATLSTLSLIQKSVSAFRNLLVSRKDIPSINFAIKFKVSSHLEHPVDFKNAGVGGSLIFKLVIPHLVQPKVSWVFDSSLSSAANDLDDEKAVVHFNAFDRYPGYDPRLPFHVGRVEKEVKTCYTDFLNEATMVCKELMDDRYRA